ncbi:unnamed protein product [Ceutorhynchus assimilis]|uniref:Cytochrome b-c1 complex subunit 10 n=1 Tax=Ceutorhynchus assimilis TaxID=467358 RepID=A0A9N9QQU8_9CUCU|nr:unnamed protein product [Ceutorhynchus assimilis]
MSLLRSLGKKQLELAGNWLGSAGVYGATASGLVVYFTDWRVVVDYLPFYNGKFPKEEEA